MLIKDNMKFKVKDTKVKNEKKNAVEYFIMMKE